MHVICTFFPDDNAVSVRGRTDYPDCGDFRVFVRPGESFHGLEFSDLVGLSGFETDPATGDVVAVTPRPPPPGNQPPFPDYLRKK